MHRLTSGTRCRAAREVAQVTLDGTKVGWQQRTTNRGVEVTVKTGAGKHTVVVTAR